MAIGGSGQDINIKINALDNTKGALSSVKRNLSGTSKAAQGMSGRFREMARATASIQGPLGAVAGRLSAFATLLGGVNLKAVAFAAGAASLTAVMLQSLKAFAQWEAQTLKVEQLIKVTGQSAGISGEQIEEMALRIGRATLSSADDVRGASAVLLSFRSIAGDAFTRTMDVASDLAALTGQELKQSVIQLGKALEDPATGMSALRRVGVSFTNSQKDMIVTMMETGEVAEAQAAILAILESQLGGAGAAAGGGLKGAADLVAENWKMMLVELGKTGPGKTAQAFLRGLASDLEKVEFWLKSDTDIKKRNIILLKRQEDAEEALADAKSGNAFISTKHSRQKIVDAQAELDEAKAKIAMEVKIRDMKESTAKDNAKIAQDAIVADKKAAIAKELADKKEKERKKEFDKDQGNAEKFGEALKAKEEKQRIHLMTLEAQAEIHFQDTMAKLQEQLSQKLITEEAANAAALNAAKIFEMDKNAAKIESDEAAAKKTKETDDEVAKAKGEFLKNIDALSQSHSKRVFKLGKAAKLANALMEMPAAIQSAYTAGAKTGPWTAIAYATMAAAASITNIQKIKAAQPPARQHGGGVLSGRQYLVGERGPELFTANASGSITNNRTLNNYGGASNNVQLTIQNYGDPVKLPQKIIDTVQDYMNESGLRWA